MLFWLAMFKNCLMKVLAALQHNAQPTMRLLSVAAFMFNKTMIGVV